MTGLSVAVLCVSLAQTGHAGNAVYQSLRSEGWSAGGAKVEFPPPLLDDGATADEERAALRALTGSDRAAAEFVRDSVTAPFLLKTSDVKTGDGVIRRADLWFVVRADLGEFDLGTLGPDEKTAEAGNMAFTVRAVGADDLARLGIKTEVTTGPTREWYAHTTARLLDRLDVESTNRVTASRTAESLVLASRTDPRFPHDGPVGNHWRSLNKAGDKTGKAPLVPYSGGAGVVTARRLATVPGALLVEARFAFHEPKSWFDGAPILRSKIGVVAQDRVRRLRKELETSRKRRPALKRAFS